MELNAGFCHPRSIRCVQTAKPPVPAYVSPRFRPTRRLSIFSPAASSRSDDIQDAGYTIRIGQSKLLIDLIGLQQGWINLRAVVGTLPDSVENASLLRMLAGRH